jgi:hypothetical protein
MMSSNAAVPSNPAAAVRRGKGRCRTPPRLDKERDIQTSSRCPTQLTSACHTNVRTVIGKLLLPSLDILLPRCNANDRKTLFSHCIAMQKSRFQRLTFCIARQLEMKAIKWKQIVMFNLDVRCQRANYQF